MNIGRFRNRPETVLEASQNGFDIKQKETGRTQFALHDGYRKRGGIMFVQTENKSTLDPVKVLSSRVDLVQEFRKT